VDPDAQLDPAGLWFRKVDDLENLRAAELRESDGFHPAAVLAAVSSARAAAAISAPVLASPVIPQPPSGDSVMRTQVRSVRLGSPAAAATIWVISRTTPS
jgi:hypothetical protein